MKLTDEQIEAIKYDCRRFFRIMNEFRNNHFGIFSPEFQEGYKKILDAEVELKQAIKRKIGLEPTQNLIQLFSWSPATKDTIQEAFS